MKNFKNLTLIIFSLFLFSACANAKTNKTETSTNAQTEEIEQMQKNDDYKILARGGFSNVETPFVFVARDAETYALLGSLIENLPPSADIDFSNTAVVAAFAGQKNTGGYSVAIRPEGEKIIINLKEPLKGEMTMQVFTTPFQVAAIPVMQSKRLPLEIPTAWTNQVQNFQVSKSDFESSGGFAGRTKKISAGGTIGVLRYNELATFIFDLSGKGTEKSLKLSDVVSGVIKNGNVTVSRLNAGTFAETPRPPLKASGTLKDKRLSLSFESHPPIAADGFTLRGTLEAVIAE